MKKTWLVLAALLLMLPSLPLAAQGADDADPAGVTFSLIPRLDLSPEFYNDGSGEFTLGNSSLYTLFEGAVTDHVTFSVMNHWASLCATDPFGGETKDLYNKTFWRSDSVNWLDWAYLSFALGDSPWSITLGKDCVQVGGFEFDAYDFEVHPAMATTLWNAFPPYQWGGKVGFTFPDEQLLSLEVASSPFGERPFSSGLYTFSLLWSGAALDGNLEWKNSVALFQTGIDGEKTHPMVSLGAKWNLPEANLTFGLDLANRVGDYGVDLLTGMPYLLSKGFMAHPTVNWQPWAGWEATASFVYEANTRFDDVVYTYIPGLSVHWYPLEDSTDFRVHASAAYNSLWETATLCFGVLYNFNLL